MMAILTDYNDVASRIGEFRVKHPDGTLQSEIVQYGPDVVIVKAYAYRSPDDPRPGVGLAAEPLPGKTNFTRDSELQNAETSAWGRALIAVGAADAKKGIASREEVETRPETVAGTPGSAPPVVSGERPPSVDGEATQVGVDSVAGLGDIGGSPVPAHEHAWVPSPKLSKWEICAVDGCMETRRISKETVFTEPPPERKDVAS
jgi:hypothetical protein